MGESKPIWLSGCHINRHLWPVNAKKYGVNFEWFFMSPDGAMLTELVTLISQGTIKTVIDSTYPMEQASGNEFTSRETTQ